MAATAGQRGLHTFSLIKNLIDWLDADVAVMRAARFASRFE
jgi:hypothetical protein